MIYEESVSKFLLEDRFSAVANFMVLNSLVNVKIASNVLSGDSSENYMY